MVQPETIIQCLVFGAWVAAAAGPIMWERRLADCSSTPPRFQ